MSYGYQINTKPQHLPSIQQPSTLQNPSRGQLNEIQSTQLLSPFEQNEKFKAENVQLKEENNILNEKFVKLKTNIVALKQNLETSIYNQLDEKSNQIMNLQSQIDESSVTINSLTPEAEGLDEIYAQQKKLRLKLFGVINQKMQEEAYYLKQEEIVKTFEEKYKALKEMKKKKESSSSSIEDQYYKIFNAVEANKEIIAKLQTELSEKSQQVKKRIDVLNSKEMEISSLKANLQYLKSETEQKYENELKLKSKLKSVYEENKQLNSFFQDNTNYNYSVVKQLNETLPIQENDQSMKQDDENMKELTCLVRNILDE